MFKLVKSEVLPLTPDLAKQFKEMDPSPTERDLNPARLKMLRDKADKGLLITFNWSTALLGDRRLRINGQHSSNMLCELNGAFPAGLKVHHDEYKVENEGDVVLLYRQLDERKSGRSVGDIAWAYQGVVPELNAVPKGTAKLAAEGIAWYQRTVAKEPTASGDEIYKMFNERVLHPFIIWLGELFSIKTPELKDKGVVGAMYPTFVANDVEAKRFWHDVAAGGHEYEESHPATVLDEWLKANKEAGPEKKLKPAQLYQGCVYAWNAYRDGKQIKEIKFDTKKGYHEAKA